jgi:hypothetical protein
MFIINSITKQIRENEHLTPSGKEQMEDLGDTVNQLTKFSKDVLSLSRAQAIKDKEKINLSQIITDCINHRFGSQKEYFHSEGLNLSHVIYGDRIKLEQAFVNLFSNSLEAAKDETPCISIRFVSNTNVLLVIVEDNGIGCNEGQMKNLFNAFYTTKKGGKGTGLGLSITRAIIEGHGGKISAYSKNLFPRHGRGLLMQLSFPLYEAEEKDAPKEAPSIVIVRENMPQVDAVLSTFRNVRLSTHVVETATEVSKIKNQPDVLRVFIADEEKAIDPEWTKDVQLFRISQQNGAVNVIEDNGKGDPQIFCEEFVLKTIGHPTL